MRNFVLTRASYKSPSPPRGEVRRGVKPPGSLNPPLAPPCKGGGFETGPRLVVASVFVLAAMAACYAQAQVTADAELPAPFTAAEFQQHAAYLSSDELAGRPPGSEGSAKAAQYLIERFQEAGLTPLPQEGSWFQEFPLDEADTKTGSLFGKNIVAVFPGRGELGEQAIIVNAHYDHLASESRPGKDGEDTIYNGADDNASGVAAILMMAKALASAPDVLGESYRTAIFTSFDAEEKGLLGAKHYVQRPLWPLDKTAAIINFDCVGRLRMGEFFAFDAQSNPTLARMVQNAAKERQLIAETRLGGHGRSDHAVFLASGIPGMHLCTGTSIDYHRVTDEWQRLNLEGGATIAWIAMQVLQQAMTYPEDFEYNESDPSFDVALLLNIMRSLGIVPNVNAQEGRYPQILFVVPGSAAAQHGLASGDQITALNGIRFNRVEDVLMIFQQLTFEEGLRLTILRDEAEREILLPAKVFESISGPQAKQLDNGKFEVQFRFDADSQVKAVYLAGEFNDWNPTALPMEGPDEAGLFQAKLELDPGVYQYKFVVDGTEWTSDPKNMYRTGEYDNSVVWVDRPRE